MQRDNHKHHVLQLEHNNFMQDRKQHNTLNCSVLDVLLKWRKKKSGKNIILERKKKVYRTRDVPNGALTASWSSFVHAHEAVGCPISHLQI